MDGLHWPRGDAAERLGTSRVNQAIVGPFPRIIPFRLPSRLLAKTFGVASGEGWSVLISGLLLPPVNASAARTSDRNARRACDCPLAGCVRPRQQPKDLPRAPNLMRKTRRI